MQAVHVPLAVLTTAVLAVAQAATPDLSASTEVHALAASLRVPIHGGAPDGGKPYGLWAATAAYKVSFDGDATFVPYLGAAWPENQPVAWRSLSVRIGEVELITAAPPHRRNGDWRCELDHGGVVETWDVRDDGLEQSFVVAGRPAAAGDLVVRGRLTTPLHAEPCAPAHQALVFAAADGTPVVRYGEAFAVDATGARVAASTAFAEGVVELRVPAAWLATARFPVVVDPLVTAVTVSTGLAPESIDVARDDTGNGLMTVFTRSASAGDYDAVGIMTNNGFGAAATVFSDITSSWSTPNARVATAADPQVYCIAIERILPDHRIRAHLHASGDTTLSTSVLFVSSGAAGIHDWRPDIGGQTLSTSALTSTGSRFLIVFQREAPAGGVFQNTNNSSIFGVTLDANGTLGTEFPIALGILSTEDDEFPSVNQQAQRVGSLTQRTDWMVVYQRYVGTGATWRVLGRSVADTGALNSGLWTSTGSGPTAHRLTPQVAGQVGRYVVAYVETPFSAAPFQTTAQRGHSLVAERVDWTPGSSPVNHAPVVLEGPNAQAWLRTGAIAYDTATLSHWALMGQSDASAGGSGDSFVVRTGFQGMQTERRTLYAQGASVEQGLVGGITFDEDGSNFVVAYGRDAGSVGSVYGRRFTYVTPAALLASGVACSSGSIAWNGSQQIGAAFSSIALTGAPASLPAIAAVSLATLDLNLTSIGMTGCRLLIDSTAPNFITSFATLTSASGSASIGIQLPETLPSATLWFQWFHFDPGANPLDLVSTQRLRVAIVK
ncbi:MAG TPA: hypothetical protein VFZ65_05255 [Planctomycetota bacterium]|nr:hypothetical protein [Planctomycetota bacterium]